jgi:hypothetical protein
MSKTFPRLDPKALQKAEMMEAAGIEPARDSGHSRECFRDVPRCIRMP